MTSQSLVIGNACRPPAKAKPTPPSSAAAMRAGELAGMFIIVVDQDANRRTVEILELRRAHSPEERGKPAKPECQRDRDEKRYAGHRVARRKRNALATTSSDEPDMASAAISGVTIPAIAIGTASML
ncbi:hypothetical protein BH10PSE14_BH10PSE14_10830 [soil metagenome]